MPKVVGVDLAVPHRGVTGLAVVEARTRRVVDLALARDLGEVVGFIRRWGPHLVVVDAPLSLPITGGFRAAERWAMKALGARFLPLSLRSMQALAEAGITLRRHLLWLDVFETHPSSAARIAGADSVPGLLRCLGYRTKAVPGGSARRHVMDALAAAAVGALLSEGLSLLYGGDAALVFPRPGLCRRG